MKRKNRSVSFWINRMMILMVLLSISILVYMNLRMKENMRRQAAKDNEDMLELYMEQIDESLNNAAIYLNSMVDTSRQIVDLQLETDYNKRQLTKYELRQELIRSTVNQAKLDGFFIYSIHEGLGDSFFTSVNTEGTAMTDGLSERRIQDKLLKKKEEGTLNTSSWFCWKMGDSYYLFRIVYDRNTWLGCWVGLNHLMRPLEKMNLEGGFSAITSEYGQILTENPTDMIMLELEEKPDTGSSYQIVRLQGDQSYLQVRAGSRSAAVNLGALIPDKNVLGDFYQIQGILLFMSLLIFLMLPLAGIMVHRFFYRPLKSLTDTMENVKEGNIEIRQEDNTRLLEFSVLTQQFNEMLDEIRHLKISVYEQKLQEKETYLQYLQLQIHPHFFLNCMSLMHGLAQLRRYQEIQRLSQSLVKYFRYMFKRAGTLIRLSEELAHIRNYMEIQKMRFPEEIACEICMGEGLSKAMLPPLSIQTFVENSVKYALNLPNCLQIRVEAVRLGDNMKIQVRDNGKGYPPKVLTVLNSDEEFAWDGDETHRIGIRNVKERLRLIFGDNSFMHFYNDNGSVTEFVLPITEGGGEDVSGIDGG